MRPRISQEEAEYIVDVLLATRKQLEEKQERFKQLRSEMVILRERLLREGYPVIKEGYHEKKQELEKLKREAFDIYLSLNLHEKLIAKYSAIANGEPHDGRYKHLSLEKLGVLFPSMKLSQVIT